MGAFRRFGCAMGPSNQKRRVQWDRYRRNEGAMGFSNQKGGIVMKTAEYVRIKSYAI